MGEKRNIAGFWWGNLTKVDKWADLGIEGRIVLK
jgi:hypothetical protein